MIPIALRITNFRSIRGTQTFNFPQAPGLYFMQGVNEAEPRLEANGAGKSTVWEALTWCFFGKTSRGLKAGEVCNWDAGKGAEVEFDFLLPSDDECVWTMKRSWSPNSWTLRHIAEYITDEEVVDLTKEKDNPALTWLALDFECWLNCVLTAQGQPMFLDMKRDAQAALFSTVMDADRWLEYSSGASKRASDQDRKVREMERELSNLQGALEATDKRDYREELESWEDKQRERLQALEEDHASLLKKRKGQKEALIAAQEREENARKNVARTKADPELVSLREEMFTALTTLERESAKEELTNDTLVKRIAELHQSSRCVVCGQEMDAAHRQAELRKAKSSRDSSDAQLDKYNDQIRRATHLLKALEDEIGEGEQERKAAERELDEAQRELSNARRTLELTDRDLDSLEDEHERLQSERNPYADMEERARKDVQRLRADIQLLQERMDAAQERQSLFQFWVRGFKDVRLMKIDEALTELEIEVNSGVDALGLLGWELQFQVDRETKAGKIERGFNCYVRSPVNDRQVPWEVWSGGEGQRLRLAGTMGLADLIRNRTGAAIPLEVWDEPTQGLSAQGIRDLLECLAERARREGRCIWVVDHKAHDFGGFAGGAVVRKTTKGTVIENGISKA